MIAQNLLKKVINKQPTFETLKVGDLVSTGDDLIDGENHAVILWTIIKTNRTSVEMVYEPEYNDTGDARIEYDEKFPYNMFDRYIPMTISWRQRFEK